MAHHELTSQLVSMTGFGIGNEAGVVVEIKGVNHKTLDIKIHGLQDQLSDIMFIEKGIKALCHRGRIDVHVRRVSEENGKPEWDTNGLEESLKRLRTIGTASERVGILASLLRHNSHVPQKKLEPFRAFETALSTFIASCHMEGASLKIDLQTHLNVIRAELNAVKTMWPEMKQKHAEERMAKLKLLFSQCAVQGGEDRVAQEVALHIERSDISEECVRLKAHLEQIEALLESPGPHGRKLEFLSAEMWREANTMNAKNTDLCLRQHMFELRLSVDRIKEQVLNLA